MTPAEQLGDVARRLWQTERYDAARLELERAPRPIDILRRRRVLESLPDDREAP